jgi:hypothetical protein
VGCGSIRHVFGSTGRCTSSMSCYGSFFSQLQRRVRISMQVLLQVLLLHQHAALAPGPAAASAEAAVCKLTCARTPAWAVWQRGAAMGSVAAWCSHGQCGSVVQPWAVWQRGAAMGNVLLAWWLCECTVQLRLCHACRVRGEGGLKGHPVRVSGQRYGSVWCLLVAAGVQQHVWRACVLPAAASHGVCTRQCWYLSLCQCHGGMAAAAAGSEAECSQALGCRPGQGQHRCTAPGSGSALPQSACSGSLMLRCLHACVTADAMRGS